MCYLTSDIHFIYGKLMRFIVIRIFNVPYGDCKYLIRYAIDGYKINIVSIIFWKYSHEASLRVINDSRSIIR